MFDRLYDQTPLLAYALSAVAVLAAGELGRFLGIYWWRRRRISSSPELHTLEGAVLGLLALMIGFTFAMTLSRFDARQRGLVEEANSISTTTLWARLLPEPQSTEIQKLLRGYVDVRLELVQNPHVEGALATAVRDSNRLQAKLWQQAVALSAADPRSLLTGLFAQNLTRMFDMQEVRLAAARNRVPLVVFALLYGIAMVAMGFSGYMAGLNGRAGRIPHAIMAAVVASVIAMVADIDRSQGGFITVDQQIMGDLKANLWPPADAAGVSAKPSK